MRVRIGAQQVNNELLEFFRRCECDAERLGDHLLDVQPRQAMLPHAARLEIEGLLRVWQKLHPETAGDVDFPGDGRVSAARR
jgi:hypothetical protein